MEEEKGFEVIDKRHTDETSGNPEAPEPETEQESPSAEAMGEQEQEALPPVNVSALIGLFINELAAIAWQRMGLIPDSLSGKIEKDLEQARLAIDCVAALLEKLNPSLSETERRDLQNLISNLRVNFVRQQGQ